RVSTNTIVLPLRWRRPASLWEILAAGRPPSRAQNRHPRCDRRHILPLPAFKRRKNGPVDPPPIRDQWLWPPHADLATFRDFVLWGGAAMHAHRWFVSILIAAATSAAFAESATPPLAPDIPKKFHVPTQAFDYERRDVMIPMRDGVKLH